MADKILRPITDVEIVEQMGENDTVLIEQGGEIKRAKGVAGGSGGGSAGDIKDFIIDILNDENVGDEVISINCDFAELWGIAHGRDTNSALKVYIRRADIFEDGVVDITWYGVERVAASIYERTPGVQESAERAVLVNYDDGSVLAIWPDNTVERYEF